MNAQDKVTAEHLRRLAYLYVRQSTLWATIEREPEVTRMVPCKLI